MSCPLDQAALDKLKSFTDICKANPNILHHPSLNFFKDFIESYGGIIPPPKMPKSEGETKSTTESESKADEYESDPDSDLDIDTEGCVEPDQLVDIEMGGEIKELSEDDTEKAVELRRKAIELFNEGKYEESISIYSEAISIDPSSALLFAKRGQAHLKLNKPNACIRDCTKALEMNPDSAAAFKFRGRAFRLLGEWEKAAQDLRQACKIDFDEQSDEWLKEVTPNAKKIEQHRLKIERRKLEREEREKQERLRKAKEARAKAAKENEQANSDVPPTGGMPGMGAAGMGDFYKLLQDQEVLAALQDPEVAAAFQDISSNPANLIKYQTNPKVMALLAKLSSKMNMGGAFPGGMPGGFPGGMPGGFPGAGAFNPSQASAPPKSEFQDDNLD